MKYYYYLYGYKVSSNLLLDILDTYNSQSLYGDIEMCISIDEKPLSDIWYIKVKTENNLIYLDLGENIQYSIDLVNDKMFINARNKNVVESTLLNLPFALYGIENNALLLHASSLEMDNQLIPICAPKGMGKTTTSVGLAKYMSFYSDDTVMLRFIKDEIYGFYGIKYAKLTNETIDILNLDIKYDNPKYNIQNKRYYNLDNPIKKSLKLNRLFFLSRQNHEKVEFSNIHHEFNRKITLHANICGATSLGYDYCKNIENSHIFKHILAHCDFIKVDIPNNKDLIHNSLNDIVNFLRG